MTATDDRAHDAHTEHSQWKWLPHLDPENANVPEWTYLVHLDPPVAGHAGHYLGSATDLYRRLAAARSSPKRLTLSLAALARWGQCHSL